MYKLLPTILVVSISMQILAFVSIPAYVFTMRAVNRSRRAQGLEDHEFLALPSRWGPVTTMAVAIGWWLGVDWCEELELWRRAHVLLVIAYLPLLFKVLLTQSVSGISAKKLGIDLLALTLRSVATSWTGILLPRESGNDFIRAIDAATAGIVLLLLVSCLLFRKTYKAEQDSLGIAVPVLACVGLALALHPNIGRVGFVADTVWAASLYLEAIAMMPQIYMIGQNGGKADEVVGYHMILMFVTRMLQLMFWWLIKGHWFDGTTFTGWLIMIAYFVQMLQLCNFLCWFFKHLMENGLTLQTIICTPTPVAQDEGKEKES